METSRERLGPLVHRSVHHGAIAWLVATLQFIGAMIVAQLAWKNPTYSLTQNVISDLGNTGCGTFASQDVCSPLHVVFNISVIVFGLLILLGILLLPTAFPARASRSIGLGLFAISAVGAILVGIFPENTVGALHSLGALLAFVGGGLGLLVLSGAMLRDTRWDGFRTYTAISGLVTLVSLVLFVEGSWQWGGLWASLGEGGIERLIVAPVLLWFLVVSTHLVRIPTFAPPGVRASSD
ncbi:MAG: DUF998 domain-containing protein [Thermoplasmata archaeon]|jgi:hypothetical membrane protein